MIPHHWVGTHCGLFGKTGSGKSTLIFELYAHFLHHQSTGGSVLIDPHGDLAKQLIRLKAADKVVFISPFLENASNPNKSVVINPFDQPLSINSVVTQEYAAFSLADSLIELMHDVSGNMRITLQAGCLVLMRMQQVDLIDLIRLLNLSTCKPYVDFALKNLHHSEIKTFLTQYFPKATQTREAIALRLIGLLASTPFKNLVCGQSSLDLASQLNQGKHLIVDLSGLPPANTNAIGKFVLATLKTIYLQRALSSQRKRVPIRLWLDEGPRFIGPSFAEILQEARKFGLTVTFSAQSYLQTLPPKLRESIRTNTTLKIMGKTSHQSSKAFCEDTQSSLDSMLELHKHQFYYHYDDHSSRRNYFFHCPLRFSDPKQNKKWAISSNQWTQRKQQIIDHYYRPVSANAGFEKTINTRETKESGYREQQPTVFYPLHTP